MNKRNLIIGGAVIAVLAVSYFFIREKKASGAADIMATVKRGEFRTEIETTGELDAKNSVKILGPTQLREFQIYEVPIQSIIDEGTVVKKGDWVANLDKSTFQSKFSEQQINLDVLEAIY